MRVSSTYCPLNDTFPALAASKYNYLKFMSSITDHTPDPSRTAGNPSGELRLSDLLAAVDVGIWYCDLPFDKLHWDAKVREHFGLPAGADVSIDTFYERLHPEDRDRTRQAIEAAIANRSEYDIEYRTVSPAGKQRWVRAIGRAFYDASNKPVRFDGISLDTTRQKEAERQLQQSRGEIQDVFNRITDGFAALDRSWTYRFINAAAAQFIGRPAAEVIGRNIFDLFPDIRQTPLWEALDRAASQQATVEVEEFFAPLAKWVSVRIFPSQEGISVYFRDITEQKRAETMLRANEAQFQTLANSIPQLAWIADASGYIFWYNQRWYEYTGATPQQMEGWGWQSVHDPQALPGVMSAWQRSIATGEAFDMVFPLRGADGIFRPFLTRVLPLRDSDGSILRWFGTNTDITEQRRTEDALRSSQERLRASLEASHTGTFQWDISSGALDWDENLDHLFGLPPGETVRSLEKFIERVHESDRAEVIARCQRSSSQGDDFDMEFRVVWPDGSIHWLYDRGKTFFDAHGRPSYMTGACVDITDRKNTEQSLQERVRLAALGADIGTALTASNSLSEMLRMCSDAIVQHLNAAFARIWTVDDTGATLELQASSGMYTHINGAHSRVPVGKLKIGLIAQERQPHLTNTVQTDPRVGDREWARREGMVAFAGYPLVVEGALVGVVALFARHELGPETMQSLASIANNIGLGIQRKRSEAALRQSEARKTAILNTALDCIITVDQDSRIVEFNPAAEATFGFAKVDAVGHSMPELIMPPNYRDMHYRGITRYLETGVGPILGKRVELEGLRRDGSIFPIELAINRIPSEGRALFTATVRDITERKRAEKDLREARDAAEAANRAKSDFLASISHELRTPLNAIIGYSEMLQEEADEIGAGALVNDLKKIHTAGRHLLALISDVLDLSKIEAGRMEVFPETFDIAAAVREVAATIEPLVTKNQNRLHINLASGLGSMDADLTKVRQSLFNLLSNAAKFTKDGDIEITVAPASLEGRDAIRFSVSDTGIGIPPDRVSELFQPFAQLAKASRYKQGGAGLGLAITKRFCELMGGEIAVSSEPGKGSEFTITLPRNAAGEHDQRGTVAMAVASSVESRPGAKTVLVIDDDPAARDLMQRYLARENINSVTAATGEEGLRLARELHPDLITLDVLMPGMDGWAVLQALKSDAELAGIPVIMASIVTDRGLGYALGATDFLIKPVTRERLAELLRKYHCAHNRCNVLLVDDDAESRSMLRSLLVKEGCDVEEAGDGLQALAAVARSKPQLILLDLLMPNMDGFEFAHELRNRDEWRRIPVIVITAKDLTAEDRKRLNGHVEKILFKGAYRGEDLIRDIREFAAVAAS